MVIWYQFSIWL